jgi:hypothetical protein
MSERTGGRLCRKVIGLMAAGKVHLILRTQRIVTKILILPNGSVVHDEGSGVGGN